MSIASELQKYNDGLLDAYSAVNTKGGTVPANKNLDNLPTAINSVPSGGTPQPLDPETVYSETRPADWMPMPAVVDNNEFYGLLHRAADSELGPIYTFYVQNSGTLTAEFGEIVNGEFVADSSLTQQVVNSGYLTCPIPMSAFGNTMSNGVAQLMVKISSTGNITRLQMSSTVGASFHRDMVDVIEHFEGRTAGYSDTYGDMDSLVYSKLITNENDNVSLQGAFSNCHSLTCLRSDGVLKNKSGASCSYIFNGCESLIAIPRINVNEATSLAYAFKDCVRIAAIPSLGDTSSVTSFNNTFKNCYRLQTVPTIDTTNATDCSTMFSACYEMDFAGMSFSLLNCSNLSSAFEMCRNASVLPTLLTSSALTNISFAFRGCENVKSVVVFDTSGVTNFSNVFNGCYALAKPPQLNTSSGTNFSAMFDYCYEMETAPTLDTSNGTNFNQMFAYCKSLRKVPQLNTSSGTNFNQMFQGCYALSDGDFSNYDFSGVTAANSINGAFQNVGGGNVYTFGDSFGANGLLATSEFFRGYKDSYSDQTTYVKLTKSDGILQLAANATTVWGISSSIECYIYVPDALLEDYKADAKWATIDTLGKLKAMSELPS